jgi:predicted ATPase
LPLLRSALDELRDMRFLLRYSSYLGTLASGLGAGGHMTEGRSAIEEALEWSERSEERWYMPELLRIKAELVGSEGSAAGARAAEDLYREALDWARRQNALSWELRAATSLAQLWAQHGRTGEADKLLSSVYGRFNEGFETSDLKTARALLDHFATTAA